LGKIGGFLHLYIGQEATAVGSIAARRPQDHVITAYRDHAHALVVGADPKRLMAELLGKATGVSKGKGGSMHLASVEHNYWGGYGIVGGHIPLGTGLALAEKYKETDAVVLCYMGDGSTNIGYFHESLNMAGVWDLPVIYIVENNQYGMGTSVARASAAPDMVTKAAGYAIPARKVNGMDVIEVYNVVGETIAAIHAGQAPQFLEINTYRFEGHSMGDPLRYRTKDEVEKWRGDDPIGILERHILKENAATKEELEQIDDEVEAVIEEAVKFAEESPFPAPEALFEGIYVDN
jgi:pyruvate dehydrogenase E1 component alpha subunit